MRKCRRRREQLTLERTETSAGLARIATDHPHELGKSEVRGSVRRLSCERTVALTGSGPFFYPTSSGSDARHADWFRAHRVTERQRLATYFGDSGKKLLRLANPALVHQMAEFDQR
jgi:hypothetical protein